MLTFTHNCRSGCRVCRVNVHTTHKLLKNVAHDVEDRKADREARQGDREDALGLHQAAAGGQACRGDGG